jgi:hypothetical protein
MIDLRAAFISVCVVLVFLLLLKVVSYINRFYVAYVQLNLLVWQNLSKGHTLGDAKEQALKQLKQISEFSKEYR